MDTNPQNPPSTYDARWFIWTIVFLVVTGISLVSYIVFSDNSNDIPVFVKAQAAQSIHKPAKK